LRTIDETIPKCQKYFVLKKLETKKIKVFENDLILIAFHFIGKRAEAPVYLWVEGEKLHPQRPQG